MEQYFALKYYEEIAGWVIIGIIGAFALATFVIPAILSTIAEWWKGRKR